MAFGLSPKHIQDFTTDNLTSDQILILALETAKKIGWKVGVISENGFVAYTEFSMSSSSEEVNIKINGKTLSFKSQCTGLQMMDWGKNKANIQNFISTFNDLKCVLNPDESLQKFDELKSGFMSTTVDSLNHSNSANDKWTGFFSIFIPTKGYFITPIIINLNIAVFLLIVITGVNAFLPDSESLLKWGANFRPLTLDGEWWRLISNCFLHIGIFHLLMNMYALLYIGTLLEPHLGKSRFSAAYLLTGIAASLTSLWWHDSTISAGASGAIFGMYGVFLAMLTTNLIEKTERKALLTSIVIFIGYNLVNGLKGGIDNAAHIGGLVSGFVIGYAYIPSLQRPLEVKLKYITVAVLSFVIVLSSIIVYRQIPNDIGKYIERMKEFTASESMALEVFKMPENTPKEKLLAELKDRGLYYWHQNITLLNELKKLNLSTQIQDRNVLLLQYCNLRLKSYELIYKSVEANTDSFQLQIKDYNQQIEKIIKELSGE